MLSLPSILLPNSRLWFPGMPLNPLGRLGVCANCCVAVSYCGACGANMPDELTVAVSGLTDDWAYFNGAHTVTRTAPDTGGYCWWQVAIESVTCLFMSPPYVNIFAVWYASSTWTGGFTQTSRGSVACYASSNGTCDPAAATIQDNRSGWAACARTTDTTYVYAVSE